MVLPLYNRDVREVGEQFRVLAERAGALVLELYHHRDCVIVEKVDGSPLTSADLVADRVIRDGLADVLPDVPVVSEEALSHTLEAGTDCFILVDPLDGTKEFCNRTGEFTINIALIEHGQPVAGIVYAPALGRLWSGSLEGGAELRQAEPGQPIAEVEPRRIVARVPSEAGPLDALVSRLHIEPETEAFLERHCIPEASSIGSSLKFCLLAQGEADLYPRFSPTMAWDTAAGHAVLNAAGGCVSRSDGSPLLYAHGEKGWLNPSFIAWSCDTLRQRLMARS